MLVEERLNVAQEYYAGIVIDSSMRVKAPVLIFSTEGGTGVEEVAPRNPERVTRLVIDPLSGLEPSVVDNAEENGRPCRQPGQNQRSHPSALYRVFKENDASSVEINPFYPDSGR